MSSYNHYNPLFGYPVRHNNKYVIVNNKLYLCNSITVIQYYNIKYSIL